MQDAARAMIDAAEQLAAERGLAALTVQAVQAAAGQRNKSAVRYHFGGRQGLIDALVAERMGPTEERRTAMLLALGEGATTRELVEVLVVPLVESVLSRRPSHWARFLLQATSDPATGLAALESVERRALEAVQARLRDRLGHLDEAVRMLRVHSAFGYAVVLLAAHEVGAVGLSDEALTVEVVDACCGLLEAPSTHRTAPDPTAPDPALAPADHEDHR